MHSRSLVNRESVVLVGRSNRASVTHGSPLTRFARITRANRVTPARPGALTRKSAAGSRQRFLSPPRSTRNKALVGDQSGLHHHAVAIVLGARSRGLAVAVEGDVCRSAAWPSALSTSVGYGAAGAARAMRQEFPIARASTLSKARRFITAHRLDRLVPRSYYRCVGWDDYGGGGAHGACQVAVDRGLARGSCAGSGRRACQRSARRRLRLRADRHESDAHRLRGGEPHVLRSGNGGASRAVSRLRVDA